SVTALPGPVAAVVALSASGLPTARFLFDGFLPGKPAARAARLSVLRTLSVTVLLYESPHRLVRTLEDVAEVFGDGHPVCVARELTKLHEEYVRGGAREVMEDFQGRGKVRGECVVILGPPDVSADGQLAEDVLDEAIGDLLERGKRTREVRDMLVSRTTMTSSELYERIEAIKKG
ncbi:MAG: SAM-dependent methyltransferase, partial [Myxococcota bacterium]